MGTSFGALCDDFYINQKLALRMDLPSERETLLHLFDAVRRVYPSMDKFRRYDDEYALESSRKDSEYRWLALRRNSVRTGHVNPQSMEDGLDFHQMVLDFCPHHLTISPLDVDYLELLFGFDLECKADHDEVVYEALMGDSPLGDLLRIDDAKVLDVQPIFGMQLSRSGDCQAYFEVKTRTKSRRGSAKQYRNEPISVFLTLRKYGPVGDINELQTIGRELMQRTEALASERLVPTLLTPIARQVQASSG